MSHGGAGSAASATDGAAAASAGGAHGIHSHENVLAGHKLSYLSGFGAEHATEALPGALPVGQNAPQKCPYGLYAEQLSGTAFTVPRAKNQRSWLYRIRPAVMHSRFAEREKEGLVASFEGCVADPNQMRWLPEPLPEAYVEGSDGERVDWLDGLKSMAGAGDPSTKSGLAIYTYTCNASMVDTAMQNADGDFLIVPQHGALHVQTEMGFLDVAPREIVVIPRGIRFRIAVAGPSRGYALELFNGHFQLPDLGPIGANGLANPRDFMYPVAAYEDRECDYMLVNKYCGKLWTALMTHSPFNVVAWHGNYAPYKYNLEHFNTMNSVSYDHPDPSIYTVLTCPTDTPGVALCDFVIFPPRWMVMEHSFRPPYYHRNCMTEFMGNIWGAYDAKVGFQPGGASLHSIMTPHGPDTDTFVKASNTPLVPHKFEGGLSFMFETTLFLRVTKEALHAPHREVGYQKCWQTLPHLFDPARRDVKDVVVVPGVAAPERVLASAGARGEAHGDVREDGSRIHLTGHAHARGGAGAGAGADDSGEHDAKKRRVGGGSS